MNLFTYFSLFLIQNFRKHFVSRLCARRRRMDRNTSNGQGAPPFVIPSPIQPITLGNITGDFRRAACFVQCVSCILTTICMYVHTQYPVDLEKIPSDYFLMNLSFILDRQAAQPPSALGSLPVSHMTSLSSTKHCLNAKEPFIQVVHDLCTKTPYNHWP